jgi:hypothetical protein
MNARHAEGSLDSEGLEGLGDEPAAGSRFDRLRHIRDPIPADAARSPP